jgi:hypothetical protein
MDRMNPHSYRQHVEDDMDSIDVRDLPEEQAQLVAAFVEFLRRQRQEEAAREALAQEQDWSAGSEASFGKDWDNEEDAVYDNWREHYHVPER